MSGNGDLVTLLARTDLFGGLATDELSTCAEAFRKAHFDKGEMLFARGDPGTHLYIVEEGRVRLAITTEDGRELSFRHAAAGDLFGEIAVLDGSPRTAEATALTPVTVYALEQKTFAKLRFARPGISDGVIAFLCYRLRETSSQLEAIALHPLEVRVARFLLLALGGRKSVPGKRVPLELGFSQGELAQLLGASRPKVNTALGALESAGAIYRTLDRIFVIRQNSGSSRGRTMLRTFLTLRAPWIAGVTALALGLLATGLMPSTWRETLRENAFDRILAATEFLRPRAATRADVPVVVIDIDRRSVDVFPGLLAMATRSDGQAF